MMTKQSKDWILGYVYARLEKHIIEAHMKKLDNIDNHVISVPKYWFGLRATKNEVVTLSEEERHDYIDRLKDLCCALNTELGSYLFSVAVRPNQQYMEFAMSATRLPEVKEMTIAEIEKELGYRIKVIGDKT